MKVFPITKAGIADFNEADYVHTTGDETIGGNKTFSNNVTVQGDLTVTGTITYVNSTTLNIGDNIITLNADETGTPTQDAGIEVERGTSDNAYMMWQESTDEFGQKVGVGAFDPFLRDSDINTTVQPLDADLTALAALSGTGLVARTGAATYAERTITGPAAGITVANGGGVAGNPTLALANDLLALEGLSSTGIAVRTTTDTWAQRSLTAPAAGITIGNNDGVSGNPTFALANDLSALEGLSSTGIAVRTGTDAWAQRTLTAPAAGFTITNPAGIAGNPTFVLADDLNALEAMSGTGLVTRTASNTYAQRTITGTTDRITLTNGSGVSGNPTVDIASTYVGQTSITTLGTITTGTWNGTDIAFDRIAQLAGLSVLGVTGNSTADMAAITAGTDHQVLRRSGTTLAFGAVNLAQSAAVTGALPITNGGTGQTSKTEAFDALAPGTTKGDLIVFNGTDHVRLPVGSAGQRLTVNSSTATGLEWQTVAGLPAENMSTNGGTFVAGGLYQPAGTGGTTAEPATLSKNFIYVGDGASPSAPEKRDFKHYMHRMPMQSGKYYAPTHFNGTVNAANQTFFTGFTYFVPTAIEIPFSAITLALNVDTLGSGNLRMGIFDDAGDKPGARVAISGDIAVTSTGVKTAAFSSLSKKPGKYWLMAEFSANQTGITGSNTILPTNIPFSGLAAYGGGHVYNVVIEAFGTDLSDYSSSTITQGTSGASNPWIMMTGVS